MRHGKDVGMAAGLFPISVYLLLATRLFGVEPQPLREAELGGLRVRVEPAPATEPDEGAAAMRVPGFQLRGFEGKVRESAGSVPLLDLGLVRVDTGSTLAVEVWLTNVSNDLVVVTDTEPACCDTRTSENAASPALPWDPALSLPIELDIETSVKLFTAAPAHLEAWKDKRLLLRLEDGSESAWTFSVTPRSPSGPTSGDDRGSGSSRGRSPTAR